MSGAIVPETQRDSAHRTDPSAKAEIGAMRERMRGLGFGDDEIAAELSGRYRLRPGKAYRITHGWTLTQAADRLNARAAGEGTDPEARASITAAHLSTDVANLLDFADHQHLPPADRLILQHAAHPDAGEPAAGYSAFGDELVRLLAERGLSQRKIAHQVPCDAGYLSKLIHGHKPPSRKIATRLEELLDAGGRLLAHVPERGAGAKRGPTPPTATHGPRRQPGTGGISVTLPCVPGRLVIEVSGLEAGGSTAGDTRAGHALRLVAATPQEDTRREREQTG